MARDLSLPAEADVSPDRLHHSGHEEDSEAEEVGDGELLYRDFIARRLAAAEVEHGRRFSDGRDSYLGYPGGLTGPYYPAHGSPHSDLTADFSSLAERFQRSGGRLEVQRRADMVDISSINQDNLTMMLTELFQDGVTQERLLVLFFFCSDLTLRALRAGLVSLASSLTDWVTAFIRTVVSGLVRCRAGWVSLVSLASAVSAPDWSRHLPVLSLSAGLLGLGLLYLKKCS